MRISEMLLPEFDQEMANTRKTLERVPEGKSDWKPHDKSMSLGRLAGHLAELPSLAASALRQDSLDFAPPGKPPMQPFISTSRTTLLETFDKNTADARAAKVSQVGKPALIEREGVTLPLDHAFGF